MVLSVNELDSSPMSYAIAFCQEMQDLRFEDSRSLIFLLALVMVSRQNVAP